MKKYITAILITAFLVAIVTGCSKSSSPTPKDYGTLIKDKTWSGAITYTGKTTEYYSVHFNVDNTLTWAQLSGEYTGHWTLDGKKITMTFDDNSVTITADISDDKEWLNIADNSGSYEIESGVLIVNPGIPLTNTVWQGTEINTNTAKSATLEINFKSESLVEIISGNVSVGTHSYSRKAGGAAFKVAGGFFGVLMSDGEMKGSDGNAAFTWQAIKK